LSYADPVAVGTASVTGPYPADQAAALSQYVQGAVQQAAVTPRARPTNSHSPLCHRRRMTRGISEHQRCMVGPSASALVGRWAPAGTFTVGITDMVNVSPHRSWSEQVTLVMQPVSGTVPTTRQPGTDVLGQLRHRRARGRHAASGQPVTLAFN